MNRLIIMLHKQKSLAVLILFLLFIVGCGDVEEPPSGETSMFDVPYGAKVESSPALINREGHNRISISTIPNYSGSGTVHVVGHGGGDSVGNVTSPVIAEIGSVFFRADFSADQVNEFAFDLAVFPEFEHIGLSISVTFDSLLVGDQLYPLNSEEARSNFSSTLGPGVYSHWILESE